MSGLTALEDLETKENLNYNNNSNNEYKNNSKNVTNLKNINDTSEYSVEALKIKNSDWRQMKCKTKKLQYNIKWVSCVYIVITLFCLPVGIWSYGESQAISYQEFSPYSEYSNCSLTKGYKSTNEWGKECTVEYTINKNFDAPIYFYYKLTNVYQNHRNYVKSRTEKQLQGSAKNVEDCSPLSRYKGKKLLPCGLIAYSFFNDKFKVSLRRKDGEEWIDLCNGTDCNGNERNGSWSDNSWHSEPNWSKKDIAWKSDKHKKFKETSLEAGLTRIGELQTWQNVTLPNTDDGDLIVWMRTASDSTFHKLHRINRELDFKKDDTLKFTIKNYFEVSDFNGKKSLVISTSGALGGKNDLLGIAYICIGCVSLLTAVLFYIFIPKQRIGSHISVEMHLSKSYKDYN